MKEKIALFLIIAIHLLLISRLVFFPYPELFVYPFLAEGGLLPYREIFDQHFPSLLMLPINLYDFGLRDAASARAFLMGSVVASHIFLYLVAKKLFKKVPLSLIPNLFYVVFQLIFDGHILWVDNFLAPVLLLSLFFLLNFLEKHKSKQIILSGFFLGLALFFKQIIFPLVVVLGLYLYLKTKSAKDVFLFYLASVLPLGLLLVWILRKDLFTDFFYWTFKFNFEVYSKMAGKLPSLKQIVVTLFLLTPAILSFLRKQKKLAPILIFLIFPLLGTTPRFEFVHLQPAIPFAAILVAGIIGIKQKKRNLPFFIYALASFLLLLNYLSKHTGNYTYFFDETTIKTSQKVETLTNKNERIFVVGSQPIIYPLSQRLPAGKVFTVNLPWNMVVVNESILNSLIKDPPSLVVRDSSATIDGKKVIDFSQKINSFIEERYIKIDQIGANEILIPKK